MTPRLFPDAVTVLPVDGVGEVGPGDDLVAHLVGALGAEGLADGDVVVLTSKVLSKAEGRVTDRPKDAVVTDETDRVLATRGGTRIVRTRHQGLVLAGADLADPVDGQHRHRVAGEGQGHRPTSASARAAISAVASGSVIISGTARQGMPTASTRATASASRSSTSQPSSSPPVARAP